MIWVRASSKIWTGESGCQIVKYRMAGSWYFLCYPAGFKDYSDYTTKKNLREAKDFLNENT